MTERKNSVRRYLLTTFLLIAAGTALDLVAPLCEHVWDVFVPFSHVGTLLASVFGGALPGIVSAVLSSVISGALFDHTLLFYSVTGALIALLASFLRQKGFFSKPLRLLVPFFTFTVIDGFFCAVLDRFVNGGVRDSGRLIKAMAGTGQNEGFATLLTWDLITSAVNSFVIVAVCSAVLALLPSLREKISSYLLVAEGQKRRSFGSSLLSKVVAVVLVAGLALGSVAYFLGYFLYRDAAIDKYTAVCRGVTGAAALAVDPERVGEYIEKGRDSDGFAEMEKTLYGIMESFPQVRYLYSYKIVPDVGCRVVFDLDVEGTEGSEVGSLVPFDESFEKLLPSLYAGEEIDPIITDDTFGWLLTVYLPVKDRDGNCVCYVAADVAMDQIIVDEASFVVKLVSLFIGFSVLIMAAVLELFKLRVVYPINGMAASADDFAYDTDEGREASLNRMKSLGIVHGDEIGDLHAALCRMAEDSNEYIDRIRTQSALIEKLRDDMIIDFAEIVEARDQCTGDHIKKTAHYVEATARELQLAGKYKDVLTDEYVAKLIRSAPLHDIGKIKISDLILNKPGKLTDEEFKTMKTHTVAGREILTNSSTMKDSEGYLKEAVEMANYHHEKWDGSGYPSGAKGEEIPLSARIMAVADVFDALVSARSYKKPFTFDEAIDIIKNGSGTHFDPTVAEAFLRIARQAYERSDNG